MILHARCLVSQKESEERGEVVGKDINKKRWKMGMNVEKGGCRAQYTVLPIHADYFSQKDESRGREMFWWELVDPRLRRKVDLA